MNNIKIIRNKKWIKQKHIADILWMSKQNYSYFEKQWFNQKNLNRYKKIAEILDTSITNLMKNIYE